MSPRPTIWSPSLIEQFLALYAEGLHFSIISSTLGISRNAAIGKAHRLGLPPRPKPKPNSDKRNSDKSRAKPRAAKMARVARMHLARSKKIPPSFPQTAAAYAAQPNGTVAFYDLEAHNCRWPLGSGMSGETFFCGLTRAANSPYCPTHAQRARRA
jgi:GcrA cell cycle regulator